MNSIPVHRRGRKYFRPGPRYPSNRHHEHPRRRGGFWSWLVTSIIIVLPSLLFIHMENKRFETVQALNEILNGTIVDLSSSANVSAGDIVHISDHISSSVGDDSLQITIENALTMERRTEYCQWEEIRTERCETCSRTVRDSEGNSVQEHYDCNCVIQYDYYKSWRPYLINSFFFDQPAAHHNPTRNPLPSSKFISTNAKLGYKGKSKYEVLIDPNILTGKVKGTAFRPVKWIRNGIPPMPSFWNRWIPDRSRYEDIADLKHFVFHNGNEFVYVGDGYFFSPYETSKMGNLLKIFGRYLEGSLFDWQIGDLFPSCQAGDIRFRYFVQDPSSVSVLAQIDRVEGRKVVLIPIRSSNNQTLNMIHSGYLGPYVMIEAQDSESKGIANFFRFLSFVWSLVVVYRLIYITGMEFVLFKEKVVAVASLWTLFSSLLWIKVWGISTIKSMLVTVSSMLLLHFKQSLTSKSTRIKRKGSTNNKFKDATWTDYTESKEQ